MTRKAKPQTRGVRCGFRRSLHVAPANRLIKSLQERLPEIAYAWDELDPRMNQACDELLAAVDAFEAGLKESVEYMEVIEE